jgi:hypothetical protein
MESQKRKERPAESTNILSSDASPIDSSSKRSKPDRERRDKPRGNRDSGFRWKRKDNGDERDGENRLERGYGNRSRSPRRNRSASPRRKQETKKTVATSAEDKFGVAEKFGTSTKKKDEKENKKPESAPERAAARPAAGAQGEPMIIVHVNDRLGTKAAIPCLASDPIKLFKAQVAARIGRQPHEILLKRQGERPFKDQLTLEDYGVSNGVQIDLEIDTGE